MYKTPKVGDEVTVTLQGTVTGSYTNRGRDALILDGVREVSWPMQPDPGVTVEVTAPAAPVSKPGDVALWLVNIVAHVNRAITVFYIDRGDGHTAWYDETGLVRQEVDPSLASRFTLVLRDGAFVATP